MAVPAIGGGSVLRFLAEQFHGQPERAVPALCLTMGLAVGFFSGSSLWALGTTFVGLFTWHYWSARLVIQDQRLGRVMLSCPSASNHQTPQVWLTFDDGPGPETLKIVELLNQAKMPATFFFIGEQVATYGAIPELLEALRGGGHSVANHSFSHPNFLGLREHSTRNEIEKTQALLVKTFRELVVPLFRPPYGYRKQLTMTAAANCGLTTVGWSTNSLDFLSGPVERVVNRVSQSLRTGSIVLFHDGRRERQRTLDAIPGVLKRLQISGFGAYSPR
jgi:peptidoglycan-N-acetylglucosamine deacetylase